MCHGPPLRATQLTRFEFFEMETQQMRTLHNWPETVGRCLFFGLALFGLWPWWLLHYLGFRGKLSAAALGFSAPVLVWALFSGGMPSAFGFGMGAVGFLVGEVIWYSAYKRGAGAPDLDAR